MTRIASLPLWTRVGLMLGALALAGGLWTLVASLVLTLGTGLFRYYAHPATQWFMYFPYRHQNARLDWWITASAVIATLAIVPGLARVVWELFGRAWLAAPRQKPLHGETRFASNSELRRNSFEFETPGSYED